MPVSDIYTWHFTATVATATASQPVGSLISPTTKRAWVVGIRVKITGTLAAAGSTCLIQLARPANSPVGTSLSTVAAHDLSAPVSLSSVATTWSTAPTISTAVGGVPAGYELPLTPGSMWEEFPPQGYEWQSPALGNTGVANAGLHVFISDSVATSSTFDIDLIFSE